ncbi:carboxylesterase/lipase family protein [Leucobacter chromiiresistens]|uniref:Carboxylic ester hydrolase n=1 Tax=Leucobacter chromiiresistens TaxID=1079994 RepID=A0A1H0YCV8_9MICO|nr:carboxylesterase family protein [Leucobacter chromiiresistens]SDQ12811.1 para-nitrobenzyl esterase [Leucobacter chromiiresistens]
MPGSALGGAPRPVVRTTAGAVRGVWEPIDAAGPTGASAAVFRGIPYAAAPVGDLRFAAPQPPAAWDGVRDAARFGPTPQRGDAGITLIPEHSVPGDNTLNVNVWTPDPGAAARLPVVVWIHGGGFISGSPASPWYDGRAFARDGVGLVTFSYRLGFTGFGWLDGAPANRGVLDWVRALEWVRQNIAAFGGDADRVTVAGQSAGGGAVLTLLGVPAARGLLHGGYAMSAAIAAPSVEAAAARTRHLARLAGVTPDAAGVSALPETRILELQRRITAPAAPRLLRDVHGLLRDGLMIGPLADGEIVPHDAVRGAALGASAHVPLALCTADDELMGLFAPRPILDRAPRRAVLRGLGASAAAVDRWLAIDEISATTSSVALVGRYATDAVFRSWVPRISRARAASDAAGATWTSRFSWHAPEAEAGAPHIAGHCSDVPFVFDRLDAPGVERVAGQAPPQALADAVHGALVRFARDGAPGWGADEAGAGPTRVFDLPVREETDAYASAAALLEEGEPPGPAS